MKRKKELKIKHFSIKELNFKNGELFHRMNYLIKLTQPTNGINANLSRLYAQMGKEISKRNALRIDSKIKGLICERCSNNLMIDASNYIEMTKRSGKHYINIICSNCGNTCEIILF